MSPIRECDATTTIMKAAALRRSLEKEKLPVQYKAEYTSGTPILRGYVLVPSTARRHVPSGR